VKSGLSTPQNNLLLFGRETSFQGLYEEPCPQAEPVELPRRAAGWTRIPPATGGVSTTGVPLPADRK